MRRYVFSFSLALLFVSSARGAIQKNVLVVHDGARFEPYHVVMSTELQKDLASPQFDLQIFDEYLDRRRLDVSSFVRAIETRYAGRKFDIIVADGEESLRVLLNGQPDFLRDTPLVFLSVPDFYLPAALPANVTGVITHRDYANTGRLAVTLQPGLRHLYLIGAEGNADLKVKTIQRELAPFRSQFDIIIWEGIPADEILKRVKSLPPNSAILFDSYVIDSEGRPYISAQFCALVAARANAPVYTTSPIPIGKGPVGGAVVDAEDIGRQGGEIILGLLGGGPISQYPFRHARTDLVVDWRQLERFGLSETNLPSSAVVLFRPPSLWSKYRYYLIGAGIVLFLQTVLIIELAFSSKRRKRSERSARELASRLISAQEDERRRIAGELHDDVSQRLALVAVHLDMLRASFPGSRDDMARELSVLYDQTDLISSDIHQFSHELHPSCLKPLGLAAALRRYSAEFSILRKTAVDVSITGDEPPMDFNTSLAFFRVGQECLTNAAKHSGATACTVYLTYTRTRIRLAVGDNGGGFDPKSPRAQTGLGIQSMRERLRSIGGTLRIRSSVLHGTRVFAEAPLTNAPLTHAPEMPQRTSDTQSAASAA
jgi:signal transduction histidine kinase